MSFPKYEHYKDSGVEWLGEVPAHWEVKSIKWISPVLRGASPRPIDDQKNFDPDGEYAWVRIADSSASDGLLVETTQRLSALGSSLSVKLEPGQLFVSIAGTVGKPCITGMKACIHDGFVYFPRLGIDPKFLYRIFEAGDCYAGLGKMGTQLNLNTDTIGSIRIAVPPSQELAQLLRFIDCETTKLDALITEQRTLIDLLKEKRQAVISHAVTKGLDPRVPMKDSGVEWLGEVPAHWEVRTVSSICTKITNGFVGPTRDILVDDGIRYLQSLHIKGNRIKFDAPYFVTQEWSNSHKKSILETGDLLIVQTGDIGQAAVVTDDFAGCNCHALIIVAPVHDAVRGEFLAWVFNSDYGQSSLLSIQTGALHPHLNCGNVKGVLVPLPPVSEQLAIVAYCTERTTEFEALSRQAEDAVVLLRERRSALISAAVTGKIDVRQAA